MQFTTTRRGTPTRADSWLALVIFLLVGIGLLVGGVYQIKNTKDFLANSKKAEGVVVDILSNINSDGQTMFRPKISFTDESGKQVIFTSDTSSSSPSFRSGEKVTVLYDPAIPEYAKIDSFVELYLFPVILIPMGLIFSLIGIFGIVSKFKKKDEIDISNQPVLPNQPANFEDVLKIIREIKK